MLDGSVVPSELFGASIQKRMQMQMQVLCLWKGNRSYVFNVAMAVIGRGHPKVVCVSIAKGLTWYCCGRREKRERTSNLVPQIHRGALRVCA
jgi:hypothetical protein